MALTTTRPLQVLPLGGCREFGLNQTCYSYADELIAVDCGLMFPDDSMFGVDLVIPDLQYLHDNRHRLRGYVITHGHEDHLGALTFALKRAPAPVYGTRFTLSLLREKLAEAHLGTEIPLHVLEPRERVQIGEAFSVEPVRVAHSIPDAVCLAIRCGAGLVVHTGDFKMVGPGLPPEGTDLERLEELGREGVLLAVSDSTNALEAGLCPSETDVTEALADLFATAPGRILVAQFSSNIERLSTVVALSARFGRQIILEGRSLIQYARLAESAGYLHFPPGVRAAPNEVRELPPRRVTVVLTGTQGEPGSMLRRLALGDHPDLAVEPGDTVVLSSRTIPGNERKVNRLVDRLCELGATVVDTTRNRRVHVSGHGFREDLRRMLLILRPRHVIPVHGRTRMLMEHAEIARQAGVERVHLPKNGTLLEVTQDEVHPAGTVTTGRVMVDGKGIGDVEEVVLRDRRALAATGTVVALITLDTTTGQLAREPELTAVGVTGAEDQAETLARATKALQTTLEELPSTSRSLPEELAEVVRRRLRSFFRRELARKPVIIPLIIEQ